MGSWKIPEYKAAFRYANNAYSVYCILNMVVNRCRRKKAIAALAIHRLLKKDSKAENKKMLETGMNRKTRRTGSLGPYSNLVHEQALKLAAVCATT